MQKNKTKWDQLSRGKKVAAIILSLFIVFFVLPTIVVGITSPSPKKVEDSTASQQSSEDLGKKVEDKYLEVMGYKSLSDFQTDPNQPTDSKIKYINGFENVSSGTVRVLVQTDITKDEAKMVGINVMGAVGLDIKNLDWIVVRGTDGKDVNVSRNDVPALR